MEHQATSQTIVINDPRLPPYDVNDEDTFFDLNNSFKLRRVRQTFISRVLLIIGIRVASLFLTILFFVLNPKIWCEYEDAILFVSAPLVIITFLCFVLCKKARASSPLNCYILVAYQIGANLFYTLQIYNKQLEFERSLDLKDKSQFQEALHLTLLITLALMTIDCLALMAVVKFTNFDVKSLGKLFWQTLLTIFVTHGVVGVIIGPSPKIALMIAPFGAIFLVICLLILRSLLMLGWVSPSDCVAASIYANDPFVYFISLCTEKRRAVGLQEQVYQMPANAQINTISSSAPTYYPSKISEDKLPN